MTRQYKWQLKQRSKGLCGICARAALDGTGFCVKCHKKRQAYMRNHYRRKMGIPLDAPLIRSGRPRKYV